MHKLVKKRAGQQFCKAQKRGKKTLLKIEKRKVMENMSTLKPKLQV